MLIQNRNLPSSKNCTSPFCSFSKSSHQCLILSMQAPKGASTITTSITNKWVQKPIVLHFATLWCLHSTVHFWVPNSELLFKRNKVSPENSKHQLPLLGEPLEQKQRVQHSPPAPQSSALPWAGTAEISSEVSFSLELKLGVLMRDIKPG